MANAIVKISKRAKQISRANKNKAWKDCIAQASREYKAGKLGAVKKASTRQTGSTNTKRDKQRRAKPPGKRVSQTGNVYYERRKNRSDKPGKIVGIETRSLHLVNNLLNDMHKSVKQYNAIREKLKRKEKLGDFEKTLYKRYPNYIKSLRKQIAEAKKNIK